jgi:hypothetical protein
VRRRPDGREAGLAAGRPLGVRHPGDVELPARGAGSVYTTFHLAYEREAAELLGIPYDDVMQGGLIPVAHTIGTDFKPGRRRPLETMVHWDRW